MKRLVYISRLSSNIPLSELERIAEVSSRNNENYQITGVLLYLKGMFFQILEGDEHQVGKLYEKILADKRHTDILCLKSELAISRRLFPNWSMKTINLDENTDILVQPIKSLLETVTESYRILEKYTQPSIIKIINQGINPLNVPSQLVKKVVFFSDIRSFSTFTEKLHINQLVDLVSHYFTICTERITQHSGEVNKFIGDSVMASFSSAQADAAIAASIEILNDLHQLRSRAPDNSALSLLYTGIGLSCGNVIEGNIGSSTKLDYTLLGDTVNVAARLESLTRQLSYSLILSHSVKTQCKHDWDFVNLGQHQVKGKQQLVEIFSLGHDRVKNTLTGIELSEIVRSTLEKVE